MKFLPLGRGNLQTLFEVPTMGVGDCSHERQAPYARAWGFCNASFPMGTGI